MVGMQGSGGSKLEMSASTYVVNSWFKYDVRGRLFGSAHSSLVVRSKLTSCALLVAVPPEKATPVTSKTAPAANVLTRLRIFMVCSADSGGHSRGSPRAQC